MALARRGFFRGLFAAPVAIASKPLLKLLPAPPIPLPAVSKVGNFGDLITATLRNRTAQLAENVMRNNAILRHLKDWK